jgi:hypothetical protein
MAATTYIFRDDADAMAVGPGAEVFQDSRV